MYFIIIELVILTHGSGHIVLGYCLGYIFFTYDLLSNYFFITMQSTFFCKSGAKHFVVLISMNHIWSKCETWAYFHRQTTKTKEKQPTKLFPKNPI